MDDVCEKVLVSIHGFLERLTTSASLTPEQLTEAHMAATALGYQLARSRYAPETLATIRRAESQVVSALAPVHSSPVLNRRWQEQWNEGVGATLAGVLEARPADDLIDVVQRVRDFLVAYHSPMDPSVSAGTKSTYEGGRGDNTAKEKGEAAITITASVLEAYLAERHPTAPATRVTEIKRLMGGYSKQTYIVKLDKGGRERTIVIRKDGYGLPTGSSVAAEYPVLRDIFDLGVPVPEPLWLEPVEGSPFATAFMAVSFEAGTPANQIVPTDPAVQRKWAESIGHVFARLHGATSRKAIDVREPLLAEIEDLQRRIEDRERAPHPGLILGMNWLRANLDDLAGRPACRIHGDVGFHNFLMRDDALLSLLDWEFSRIGDPVEDLIPLKSFMDQISGWDHFYAAYRERCDFEIDAKAARYFNVWREVRNMVACLGSLNSLLLPQVKDVALSVAGTIYIPKYEVAVLDAILEVQKANV